MDVEPPRLVPTTRYPGTMPLRCGRPARSGLRTRPAALRGFIRPLSPRCVEGAPEAPPSTVETLVARRSRRAGLIDFTGDSEPFVILGKAFVQTSPVSRESPPRDRTRCEDVRGARPTRPWPRRSTRWRPGRGC